MITDCLENRFTTYDIFDDKNERRIENSFKILLASIGDTPLEKLTPCNIYIYIYICTFENSLDSITVYSHQESYSKSFYGIISKAHEGRSLLKASQFGFRALLSTNLQCMRFMTTPI
jgi:hypothetical protein